MPLPSWLKLWRLRMPPRRLRRVLPSPLLPRVRVRRGSSLLRFRTRVADPPGDALAAPPDDAARAGVRGAGTSEPPADAASCAVLPEAPSST